MTDTKPLLDEQGPTADVQDVPRSRRQLLTMAGAAVAGGTALALTGANPAGAANGDPVLLGSNNTATATTFISSNAGLSGVLAVSATGDGTNGLQAAGQGDASDVKLNGTGRLAQVGALTGTAQPTWGVEDTLIGDGVDAAHELVRTTTGLIWASAGGAGSSTTWKRINAVRFDNPNGNGTAFSPFRLLDTRSGSKRSTNINYVTDVAGHANIPDDAIAIFGNVTVVSPNWTGFLTLFPTGTAVPTVANLNFSSGEIAGNFFMVGLGTGGNAGDLSVRAGDVAGKTYHVIIDVFGYVQ